MRTRAYVDGYNLYYACLRRTPFKWLDLVALVQQQLPNNQLDALRYFTARVRPRPHDPGQPIRQEVYLRALSTRPEVQLHFGHFLTHEVTMPDAAAWQQNRYVPVRVVKTEEKGSDVNLATHLLMDAVDNLFDVAVIISNDSDLAEPIRLVRERFGKKIVLLGSRKTRISGALRPLAHFIRQFPDSALQRAQFPPVLINADERIHKPQGW